MTLSPSEIETYFFDDAISYYERALLLNQNLPLIHLNISSVYQSINKIDEAKKHLNKAILIDETTLVTGDIIRANEGGKLSMLPEEKIQARELALNSIKRLAAIKSIEAVIPGDGWPVFKNGHDALTAVSYTHLTLPTKA